MEYDNTFSEEEIRDCDNIAKQYLAVSNKTICLNRQFFKNIPAIHYKDQENDGKAIIVCKDKSFLLCSSLMPLSFHVEAFKSGLRSDPKTINKLI